MKKLYCLFIIIHLTFVLRSQGTVTVSGYIKDSVSGESLLGAILYNATFEAPAQTNNFGFFSLQINKNDSIELICSFTGFDKKIISISAANDTMITVLLSPSVNILKAVVIDAHKNSVLNDPVMSVNHISITEIKLLPSVLGETDILKTFQLTPGVQPGQEGTSALYVRGGTPDQNLILLDDIPLYYIDHAGGFFFQYLMSMLLNRSN